MNGADSGHRVHSSKILEEEEEEEEGRGGKNLRREFRIVHFLVHLSSFHPTNRNDRFDSTVGWFGSTPGCDVVPMESKHRVTAVWLFLVVNESLSKKHAPFPAPAHFTRNNNPEGEDAILLPLFSSQFSLLSYFNENIGRSATLASLHDYYYQVNTLKITRG